MEVTSGYLERCKPFKIKMSCGHTETRMARESLFGITFDASAAWQVETDRRRCEACREQDGHE